MVEASAESSGGTGLLDFRAPAPWFCSRSRSRTRSRSTAPTSVSPPSSDWPFSRCSTSPRRAKSSACANGRAVRPSARRSSSRPSPSTPRRRAAAARDAGPAAAAAARRAGAARGGRADQRRRQAQAGGGRRARVRARRGRARAARAQAAPGPGRRSPPPATAAAPAPAQTVAVAAGEPAAAQRSTAATARAHAPAAGHARPRAAPSPPPPPLPPRRRRRRAARPRRRRRAARATHARDHHHGHRRRRSCSSRRDLRLHAARRRRRADAPPTATPAERRSATTDARRRRDRDADGRRPRRPRKTALIVVFNGTPQDRPGRRRSETSSIGDGYPEGNLGVGTPRRGQQRQTSVVMYAPRRQDAPPSGVADVARHRPRSQQLDDATQALIAKRRRQRSGTWSSIIGQRQDALVARAAAMTLVARVTFVVLVGATFAAFFVAQRLKSTPPVIDVRKITRYFSPNGDGKRDANDISISLQGRRRRDRRRRQPRRRPRPAAGRERADAAGPAAAAGLGRQGRRRRRACRTASTGCASRCATRAARRRPEDDDAWTRKAPTLGGLHRRSRASTRRAAWATSISQGDREIDVYIQRRLALRDDASASCAPTRASRARSRRFQLPGGAHRAAGTGSVDGKPLRPGHLPRPGARCATRPGNVGVTPAEFEPGADRRAARA